MATKYLIPSFGIVPQQYYAWADQHGEPKETAFQKMHLESSLRQIRFRHTFASLLIQNGESLAYVKDQLGHGSIKMTVDVYGHLVPGANRAAVNRLPGLSSQLPQAVAAD